MGMRNASREELRRLEAKTLEARFLKVVREGLGCSPFEARAVLGVVKEVSFPFVDEAAAMGLPGKAMVIAVSAEEPAGKAVGMQGETILFPFRRRRSGVRKDFVPPGGGFGLRRREAVSGRCRFGRVGSTPPLCRRARHCAGPASRA